jgi:uncharacterized protein (TIGR03118 family)
MAGVSTLYNGSRVKQTLRVTIPHTPQTAMGSPTGIVFKGVPNGSTDFDVAPGIAQHEGHRFLYVADIASGKIKVYNTDFEPVNFGEDAFDDDRIPPGFTPFNVQNIGDNLYVAYAKQNQTKTFVDFGAGLGFVDVFSPRGRLLMRLEHGDWLNAPWG